MSNLCALRRTQESYKQLVQFDPISGCVTILNLSESPPYPDNSGVIASSTLASTASTSKASNTKLTTLVIVMKHRTPTKMKKSWLEKHAKEKVGK